MLVIKNIKLAQHESFLDEIYPSDDKPDGIVGDENYHDYLVDDIENYNTNDDDVVLDTSTGPDRKEQEEPLDYRREVPTKNKLLGIPENAKEVVYFDGPRLAYDGIKKKEVISFEYTNRHGAYAGLRTVEPHYTFMAKSTGNEILVSYDRDINDIRAFIVGNIHPQGVRYNRVRFKPRNEIMIGVMSMA